MKARMPKLASGKRGKERKSERGRRLPPVEVLLVLACVVAALVLAASELVTTFQLVNPGGEALDPEGGVGVSGGDRHSYVMAMIAFFALFCLALAVLEGSKPAAVAVAVSGGLALLLFLIIDLPDAGKVGAVNEPVFLANAEIQPRPGFWLELIGALSLAVSGAALATLSPEQLQLRGRIAERLGRFGGASDEEEPEDEKGAEETKSTPARRRREDSEERPERVKDRVERVRRAATRRRGE